MLGVIERKTPRFFIFENRNWNFSKATVSKACLGGRPPKNVILSPRGSWCVLAVAPKQEIASWFHDDWFRNIRRDLKVVLGLF